MRELDKISASLFEKIRARFDTVSLGNNKANSTSDPEQARFINFDYVGADGENYGNVTLSLIDEDSLKVYFGSNITEALSEQQERHWYAFLKELRMFASCYSLIQISEFVEVLNHVVKLTHRRR